MLLASIIFFAIDYALQAIAPTLAWPLLGRAVAGLTGAIYGLAGAVIADVSPPEKRSAAYNLLGAAFGIAFVIGPALGRLVATQSLAWGSLHRFDGTAFLVAGGLIGAAALIIAATVRPGAPAPAAG